MFSRVKNKVKSIFSSSKYIDLSNHDYSYVGGMFRDLFDGDKFPGSFGVTKDFRGFVDYYTLRLRSSQIFTENLYAKGMIRRLVTNEIHTGLKLEAHPIGQIIGLSDDESMEWGDKREVDWELWADDATQCDWGKQKNLTEQAVDARIASLVSGDVLVVLRINPRTGLPAIQLIDGANIVTPFGRKVRAGNTIVHGVELDRNKRHVAYWVNSVENGKLKSKRIPAFGEKSGRKVAWLVYGTERRLDNVRGEPILSSMLYMLKELDRYRDSETRAATVNAMLAYFIKRDQPGVGTRPIDAGATRRGSASLTQPDGTTKAWNYAKGLPGVVMQNLAAGETPEKWDSARPNVNFKGFEEAVINALAWSIEVPPETLRLMYTNSFSASRQANNEFEIYLTKRFKKFGNDFYQPVYNEHTINSVLLQRVEATGLIEAWRDPKKKNVFNAWVFAEWMGISRPSVDIKKEVDAAAKALDYGIGSGEFWNRRITGQNYFTSHKQRKREIDFDKSLGLSFSSEENNNKEPIQIENMINDIRDEQGNILNMIESGQL